MKVYRQHNCTKRHRTHFTMAKCVWRKALWVSGDGPFASVSYCPHMPYGRAITVELHQTSEAAQQAKARIDDTHCGNRCQKDHELIELVLPGKQ